MDPLVLPLSTHPAGGGPEHNTHLQSGCIFGYDSEGVIYHSSQGWSGDTLGLEQDTQTQADSSTLNAQSQTKPETHAL